MKIQPSDIQEQIIAMGRQSWLDGLSACPFGPKSNAAKLWSEGWEEMVRFPLLAMMEEASK